MEAPSWATAELHKKQQRLRELTPLIPAAVKQLSELGRTDRLITRIREIVAPGWVFGTDQALIAIGRLQELVFTFDEPTRLIAELEALKRAIAEAREQLPAE